MSDRPSPLRGVVAVICAFEDRGEIGEAMKAAGMTSLAHAPGVAVVVSLLLVGLLASPAPAQGPTGRVMGHITDADTGAPLSFANVTVLGTPYGNISNQGGEYLIEFVPVGTYVVQATYMGYTSKRSETITVTALLGGGLILCGVWLVNRA